MEANKIRENEVLDNGEIVERIPSSPSFLCGVVGNRGIFIKEVKEKNNEGF
jgi:chemotaxis signal transduction protein